MGQAIAEYIGGAGLRSLKPTGYFDRDTAGALANFNQAAAWKSAEVADNLSCLRLRQAMDQLFMEWTPSSSWPGICCLIRIGRPCKASERVTLIKELAQVIITTFSYTFITPFYWVVVLLVFFQHQRLAGLEKKLFGRTVNRIWPQLSSSIGLGALGGFLAGLMMVFLGLSLEQMGLIYIWPVAILLLLVNPRYLCFSYAGIVALLSILIRLITEYFPSLAGHIPPVADGLLKIHIPALLALIALLHLMESLLISLSGHWGFSPVYFKRSGEEVVGGFTLQRFWPLPLVALLVSVVITKDIVGVSMPEWWPVIKSTLQPPCETLQYLAALVGRPDMPTWPHQPPREKRLLGPPFGIQCGFWAVAIAGIHPRLTLPGILFAPGARG